MRALCRALFLALLAVGASSCGPDAKYCDSCETAVAPSGPDGGARLIRGRCVVNGQEIDCGTAAHSACPSCR